LASQGVLEGSGNTHPGQGTANRRFFFGNAYLELIWVCDPVEAQSDAAYPTQLWERWFHRHSGVCPFGLVYRPGSAGEEQPPFLCWSYRPAYLPEGLSIEVGREIPLHEPQLFYLPFLRNRGQLQSQPVTHPAGIDRITRAAVSISEGREPSATLAQAIGAGLLSLKSGSEYLLELGFEGTRERTLDLRPHLRVVFKPDGPFC
jgi:hypothetical protein